MSQENVEIVTRYFGAIMRSLDTYWEDPRSIAEALESGDLDPNSREVLDHIHPDMRWKNALGHRLSREGRVRKGVDELLEASRSYMVTVDQVTDLGSAQVLAVLGVGLKGKSSGAAATGSIFSGLTLRDGLIAEADEYLSRADALEAVGVEE
jgi:ketosteroid isomerase-like protein